MRDDDDSVERASEEQKGKNKGERRWEREKERLNCYKINYILRLKNENRMRMVNSNAAMSCEVME